MMRIQTVALAAFLVLFTFAGSVQALPSTSAKEDESAGQELSAAQLEKAVELMAKQALAGQLAFDTDEIEAATGVDIESVDEQVLQQAIFDKLAELRAEMPAPAPGTQDALVPLETFDQFVATFNQYEDVPRIVLLLSPT